MEAEVLQVRMLGKFVISRRGQALSWEDSRSSKGWLILAYLILHRRRAVSTRELTELFGKEGTDPANAMKTTLYRVRGMLDRLGSGSGRLICRRNGGYAWDTEVPMQVDVEEFEALCGQGASTGDLERRLELYLQALHLYQGDLLPRFSAQPWLIPVCDYYHDLYVRTAREALSLLEEQGRLREAAELGRRAVEIEPFDEELYSCLMESLFRLGDRGGVMKVYDSLRRSMLGNFGIAPSEKLREIYQKACVSGHAVSADALRDQLAEKNSAGGSMLCDYDFFKSIYHATARAIPRSGSIAHVCLFTVLAKDGGTLGKRSLDLVMENLRTMIHTGLRKGDVAAQCSVSQYIAILPQANYENSCMVGGRIVRSFCRLYPHTPAQIQYAVWPLEPNG